MSAEVDPVMRPAAPVATGERSRAGEVLDRLAREGSPTEGRRRSWRLRQPSPAERSDRAAAGAHADTPGHGSGAAHGRAGLAAVPAWSTTIPARLGVVLAVIGLLVAGAAVVLARRPPPIEDRLPVAAASGAAEAPVAAGAASSAVDSSSTTPGPSAAGAAPEGASAASSHVVVHVAGAVTAPGVVRLFSGSRVVDAVTAAGGLRPDADPDRLNLAAPLVDGQRVAVPVIGQPAPAEVAAGPGSLPAGAGGSTSQGPIDLNTATVEQLDTLPGVGPSTAAAIVDHRQSSGPFRSVDALLDVRGIGEAKLDALRDLVTVSGT